MCYSLSGVLATFLCDLQRRLSTCLHLRILSMTSREAQTLGLGFDLTLELPQVWRICGPWKSLILSVRPGESLIVTRVIKHSRAQLSRAKQMWPRTRSAFQLRLRYVASATQNLRMCQEGVRFNLAVPQNRARQHSERRKLVDGTLLHY